MKAAMVLAGAVLLAPALAWSADITVPVHAISADGVGAAIGTLRAVDTPKGLMIRPRISSLTPGAHGFHVHQNPACGPQAPAGQAGAGVPGAGLAAGGHFDPDKYGRHEGPQGQGHKGDLPVLQVDDRGRAGAAVLAPRLRVADILGRAIVIHAGGDNYADQPAALGGGGARVACAVVPAARQARKSG